MYLRKFGLTSTTPNHLSDESISFEVISRTELLMCMPALYVVVMLHDCVGGMQPHKHCTFRCYT